MEQWSNNACFGYAIAAAERIGMKSEQIDDLVKTMRSIMDMDLSVEEAKEVYNKSPY